MDGGPLIGAVVDATSVVLELNRHRVWPEGHINDIPNSIENSLNEMRYSVTNTSLWVYDEICKEIDNGVKNVNRHA